jgi:hypothetical protein
LFWNISSLEHSSAQCSIGGSSLPCSGCGLWLVLMVAYGLLGCVIIVLQWLRGRAAQKKFSEMIFQLTLHFSSACMFLFVTHARRVSFRKRLGGIQLRIHWKWFGTQGKIHSHQACEVAVFVDVIKD